MGRSAADGAPGEVAPVAVPDETTTATTDAATRRRRKWPPELANACRDAPRDANALVDDRDRARERLALRARRNGPGADRLLADEARGSRGDPGSTGPSRARHLAVANRSAAVGAGEREPDAERAACARSRRRGLEALHDQPRRSHPDVVLEQTTAAARRDVDVGVRVVERAGVLIDDDPGGRVREEAEAARVPELGGRDADRGGAACVRVGERRRRRVAQATREVRAVPLVEVDLTLYELNDVIDARKVGRSRARVLVAVDPELHEHVRGELAAVGNANVEADQSRVRVRDGDARDVGSGL